MSDKIRNDSILYSGLTSASFNKAYRAKARRQADREKQKSYLEPSAELIKVEIQKTKDQIATDTLGLIQLDADKDDIKSLLVGARLAQKHIAQLEQRLLNILRTPKSQEKKKDEDTDT